MDTKLATSAGQMNPIDWQKWRHNLLKFTIPVFILYFTQVINIVSAQGHFISWSDFSISQATIGGMTVYVLSSALDFMHQYLNDSSTAKV